MISYGERWFQPGRRMIKALSVDEAAERHERRQPYVALIGPTNGPACVLSLAGKWVTAAFLDSHGREFLSYDFREERAGVLFLSHAKFREFHGDTDQVTRFLQFAFDEDGTGLIEDQDLASGTSSQRRWKGETAENWEDYPEFAKYDAFCRRERLAAP